MVYIPVYLRVENWVYLRVWRTGYTSGCENRGIYPGCVNSGIYPGCVNSGIYPGCEGGMMRRVVLSVCVREV